MSDGFAITVKMYQCWQFGIGTVVQAAQNRSVDIDIHCLIAHHRLRKEVSFANGWIVKDGHRV
jgi:hypothetical protein